MNQDLMHLLTLLEQLQGICEGDPEEFGKGRDRQEVQEVIEAWEATNMLSDMFLNRVKAAQGSASN